AGAAVPRVRIRQPVRSAGVVRRDRAGILASGLLVVHAWGPSPAVDAPGGHWGAVGPLWGGVRNAPLADPQSQAGAAEHRRRVVGVHEPERRAPTESLPTDVPWSQRADPRLRA